MIDRKFQESRAKRGRALKLNGPVDLFALFLATGFGAGFMPFGPGTWGSLVGLLMAYGLITLFDSTPQVLQGSLIVASALLAAAGIWSGTRAEKIFDRKDAGQIVIDEVCGQLISFVLIAPYLAALGPRWQWWLIAGFVLFRIFDIFKPYPLNRLQSLTGGLGVMIDDIIAGIYAAAILSLAMALATA
jgi:phosphatidylglycerophosphatase A